jgi:hypothetical protein
MKFTKKILRLEEEVKTRISSSGGLLHIVLEDGNYEDRNIMYCINRITEEYQIKRISRWQFQLYMELAVEYLKHNKIQNR